jgi:hypothetical protein
VRDAVHGLLRRVLGQRDDGPDPAEAVAPQREPGEHAGRECEAQMADGATGGARLERAQHEEDRRHPFQRDRQRPRDACEIRLPSRGQRERAQHEDHHQRVVVPSAGEVNGEERVPADERGGQRGPAAEPRRQPDERQHAERRRPAVEPGGDAGRLAGDGRVAFREEREAGAVDARRVTPVLAHHRVRRVARELGRRHVVRALAVHGADAPVGPVCVGIRREQDRTCERGDLDEHGDREHRSEAYRRRAAEREAHQVEAERAGESAEVEPRPAALAAGVVG